MIDTSSIGMTWIGLAIIDLCKNRTKVKVKIRNKLNFSFYCFSIIAQMYKKHLQKLPLFGHKVV